MDKLDLIRYCIDIYKHNLIMSLSLELMRGLVRIMSLKGYKQEFKQTVIELCHSGARLANFLAYMEFIR